MAGEIDLVALRKLLAPVVASIGGMNTRATLRVACERLGLPTPPDEGTKNERCTASFAALPDARLPELAARLLAELTLDAQERNAVQDLLWAAESTREIPKRTRRELARDLDFDYLIYDADRFNALLDRWWVLDDDPFSAILNSGRSLRERVCRHVYANPGDWSVEDLFDHLGAFDASDRRFALFLEGLTSAEVVPDEPTQRRIANTINQHLRKVGIELREIGSDGGYPLFSFVSTRSTNNGRPKNLIFASPTKPDIRIRDAINNDIEIVDNADTVLVYDRPIGPHGLRWRDLQTWWKDTYHLDSDEETKTALYQRLRHSLPLNSPPQRHLFDLYHEIFSSRVYDLPALLPEVWLHWDPKTVARRGAQALLRHRMDFLLLLPRGHRIVLEVDGMHHYAHTNRQADPIAYAANMRADRELRFSGYEVFRFGATELQDRAKAKELLQRFFEDLFRSFE